MTVNNRSQIAELPAELTASMTGSWVTIGTLLHNPVQIIFDNQGTVPVAISNNGGTKTGELFQAEKL